jgi:DNA-binding beta-propeller fold protein YncE
VKRLSSRRALSQSLAAAALAVAALAIAGCGNTYRPVVASINPVGPAGQPTKYAVAISSASATSNGLVSIVDFSGDTILDTTLIGLNPYYFVLSSASEGYTLNSDGTLTSFSISTSLLASQVLQSTLLPNSLPVSITPVGTTLYIPESGRNAVAELTSLPPAISQELPTGVGTNYVVGISGASRIFALVNGVNSTSNGTAVTIDTTSNTITNSLPVGINPVYGVMNADTRRAFVLNKGSNNVTVINAQSNALDTFNVSGGTSSTIPVGVAPVWADFAPTLNEMLVVNQGAPEFSITGYSIASNVVTFQTSTQKLTAGQQLTLLNFPTTSSFFNAQTVTVSATGLTGASFQVPFTHANATSTDTGNGIGNGTVTVVSIPECTQTTVVTNPNCDSGNPIDAVGFGTVLATIPVGPAPVMISALQDGTQAYVANAGVLPTSTTPGTPGSISAISLTSDSVIATIPGANSTTATDGFVHGHPTYIGSTTGTPTGKVYVVSTDSTDLTIIRTDVNTIQTHLSLQGNGISLRMTSP